MSHGTAKFILKSTLRMIILLFAVSILCWALISASPIDPVDAFLDYAIVSPEQRANIAEYWGFNKPATERCLMWLGHALQGNLGMSITFNQPVIDVLSERFQASLLLMGTAWVLSGVFGLLLGILAGVFRNRWIDKLIKFFCFILASTPVFWLGLLALVVFSVSLGWFPLGLAAPIGKMADQVTWADRLYHLALPALTLSITGVANIALHTREKLIDVLDSDYVLFARARGETTSQIIWRHGIRNIALPALTLQFASFSELFGGSVLAEKAFSYLGLGNAATIAGLNSDAALLLGVALFSALFVFIGNMIANILYGVIDPQIAEGVSHDD